MTEDTSPPDRPDPTASEPSAPPPSFEKPASSSPPPLDQPASGTRPPTGSSAIPTPRSGLPSWAPLAAGAIVVVVAVVLFLALRGGDDDDPTPTNATATTTTPKPPPATVTDPAKVAALAKQLGRPVYWAGPAGANTQLELTRSGQNVYLRYLTGGAQPGDTRPNFLTIGSYGQADPVTTVQDALKQEGAQRLRVSGGGVGVYNPARPKSVYLAFPDGKELVEVYSPTDARAKTLVQSRRIRAVNP